MKTILPYLAGILLKNSPLTLKKGLKRIVKIL